MRPEIIQRSEQYLMGYQKRIQPMEADYLALWRDGFEPHEPDVSRIAVEPTYYGAYYGTSEPGRVDFVAGMLVPKGALPMEGLVVRALPGGLYARFRCTMATISLTWRAIYGQWLRESGYAEDETRPAFECFPAETASPEAKAEIWVPVRSSA